MKPLLLIDVDGPLNCYAASNNTVNKHNRRNPDHQFRSHKLLGYKVWLSRWHGEELNKLADVFDLTWCTTWEHDANNLIGPKIGLPELPVIEFDKEWPLRSFSDQPDRVYYKTPTVVEYAAGRPFAWVDDEISAWDDKYVVGHHGGPAHLLKIDPSTGLTQEHFNTLASWATGLETS